MVSVLPLENMHLRHWGLTPSVAANNTEAATVCLSRHHSPPATFRIENNGVAEQARVEWVPPDTRTLSAWNNRTDTTEMGAYACVIAAVELVRGHFAVRRAENDTGADYYMAPAGSGIDDLEDCYRLEVSGTDVGNEREIRQRVLQKAAQTRRGDSNLPAITGVVGFAARMILVADVEKLV